MMMMKIMISKRLDGQNFEEFTYEMAPESQKLFFQKHSKGLLLNTRFVISPMGL
jgi:hypothetical protein